MTNTETPRDPRPGDTCHVGKGKTLWEIITVHAGGRLDLSAIGKGGYSNRTVTLADITDVQPGTLQTPLRQVIKARKEARNWAASLNDQLRYCSPNTARYQANQASTAAHDYAATREAHSVELAALNIKES